MVGCFTFAKEFILTVVVWDFFFLASMFSLFFPLLLMMSPKYLYVLVSSMGIVPSVQVVFVGCLGCEPTRITLHFDWPHLNLCLVAKVSTLLNMSFWLSSPSANERTSSTHSNNAIVRLMASSIPTPSVRHSSAYTSIIFENMRPVSLEPWRPPISIGNSSVGPKRVFTCAFRFFDRLCSIRQDFPLRPLSHKTASISSGLALSYALATS